MKTVWVLDEGSYSDYHVVGVYSSKENAQVVYDALHEHSDDMDEPEEWELDPGVDELRKGYNPFSVVMLRDGTTERIDQTDRDSYSLGNRLSIWERTEAPAALFGVVWARNAKHAIKIANEHRARMIANGEWK